MKNYLPTYFGGGMKHLSLFSGIGGFDLAAEWMGWENVAHCEIEPYCLKVLKKLWPHANTHTNIFDLNGEQYADRIDIISGGFPCQPFSIAGEQKGTGDDRHLWPEMLRIIREVRPRFVVAENVRGLLSIESGMVFRNCIRSLEDEGYEVQPFVIPAVAVGADHRRDRVWIVAHSDKIGCNKRSADDRHEDSPEERTKIWRPPYGRSRKRDACPACAGHKYPTFAGSEVQSCAHARVGRATEPPVLGANHGVSHRSHRIAALGNAIVPQIAYQIFRAIAMTDDAMRNNDTIKGI